MTESTFERQSARPSGETVMLEVEIYGLETENASLQWENARLREESGELQRENAELRGENARLRGESGGLQRQNGGVRGENAELRREDAGRKSAAVVEVEKAFYEIGFWLMVLICGLATLIFSLALLGVFE